MSDQTYKLNELAGQDYFTIDLDGHIYRMSYPSAKDILDLDKLGIALDDESSRLEEITSLMLSEEDRTKRQQLTAEAEQIKDKLSNKQTSLLDWAINYIKPEDKDAPNFKELLMKKSVKYLLAFINIMQKELQ